MPAANLSGPHSTAIMTGPDFTCMSTLPTRPCFNGHQRREPVARSCSRLLRMTTPCNKRAPGSGCSAVGGYTRDHAVLGVAAAPEAPPRKRASPQHIPQTWPSPWPRSTRGYSCGDQMEAGGSRSRSCIGCLAASSANTVLGDGELITAIDLPPLPCWHRVGLPQGAGPRVLRVRVGIGRCGAGGGRWPGR